MGFSGGNLSAKHDIVAGTVDSSTKSVSLAEEVIKESGLEIRLV